VPMKQIGWMSKQGEKLQFNIDGIAQCPATGERYKMISDSEIKLIDEA